jgi:hypothetical protein
MENYSFYIGGRQMLKVSLEYDLPEFDPNKHDPDKVFRFLTYRGVHYAKMVYLKSRGETSWKISK